MAIRFLPADFFKIYQGFCIIFIEFLKQPMQKSNFQVITEAFCFLIQQGESFIKLVQFDFYITEF